MGITGTDVTKGAADMVLADDNFATIVNAVEEGRKIYDNVRKVLQFQLSTNMSEVVVIFASSVLGVTMLTPAHLLWINMVTDSAPGLALGMEKAEGDLMKRNLEILMIVCFLMVQALTWFCKGYSWQL